MALGGPEATMKVLKVLSVTPIAVLVITAGRLILVADYDTTTALAIAAAGGFTGTLVGTAIPLLPPYLPVLAILCILWQRWGLLLFTAVVTAFISPVWSDPLSASKATGGQMTILSQEVLNGDWSDIWQGSSHYAAIAALIGLVLAVLSVGSATLETREESNLSKIDIWDKETLAFLYGFGIAIIAAIAVLFAQNLYGVPLNYATMSEIMRRPWLPAEEVLLKSQDLRVGYTLATKDGWFQFLTEETRRVEYIPASQVTARRVCSIGATDIRLPLWPLTGSNVIYPHVCVMPRPSAAELQNQGPFFVDR